ncbi:S-adenosylhomocysteine hydrolase [Roseibium denhamense]|nr:S-adenosylhomocysteine hydrolase [Roseibium denhamense]
MPPSFCRADYLPALVERLNIPHSRKHRFILVGHLFDDTMRMVEAVRPVMPFDAIVGVPYSSGNPITRRKWQSIYGPAVHCPETEASFRDTLKNVLRDSLEKCRAEGQKLIIQEVSGYVLELLHQQFAPDLHLVEGVVEITKQGVWRAARPDLKVPVLHCAESELKRFEARRSGEAIVRSLDGLARDLGIGLAGRHATVFGAGWIGTGAAETLKRIDAIPFLVDTDPLRVAEARLCGFQADLVPTDLERSDLVIGATGQMSIPTAIIDRLRDGCILASGSSRCVEIDVGYLEKHPSEEIHSCIRVYDLPAQSGHTSRRIGLVNKGFPANFIPGSASVPDEIMELVLGELIVLMARLVETPYAPGLHAIDRDSEALCARLWIDQRNRI